MRGAESTEKKKISGGRLPPQGGGRRAPRHAHRTGGFHFVPDTPRNHFSARKCVNLAPFCVICYFGLFEYLLREHNKMRGTKMGLKFFCVKCFVAFRFVSPPHPSYQGPPYEMPVPEGLACTWEAKWCGGGGRVFSFVFKYARKLWVMVPWYV